MKKIKTIDKYTFAFILNILLCIVIGATTPAIEWPDSATHIARKCTDNNFFPLILSTNDSCAFKTPATKLNFKFFSDSFIHDQHTPYAYTSLILTTQAAILLIILFIISKIKITRGSIANYIPFCPPLVFSLFGYSGEPYAISLLLASYLTSQDHKKSAAILSIMACAIDRSMLPISIPFLLLLNKWFSDRLNNTNLILGIYVAIVSLIILTSPIELFQIIPSPTIYGISIDDIIYNSSYGKNNYAALAASVAGLAGHMSLRPLLWFIYYPLTLTLLLIGYCAAQKHERNKILVYLAFIMLTLFALPSLSQARYYPIFTILIWKSFFDSKIKNRYELATLLAALWLLAPIYWLIKNS